MLPDRVSNPGPLTYESGALPIDMVIGVESKLFPFVSKFKVEKLWKGMSDIFI